MFIQDSHTQRHKHSDNIMPAGNMLAKT